MNFIGQQNRMVSIIVPIFNAERFLPKCIESIISQTYSGIELLLINDGSMDNSKEICKQYAAIDGRIKWIGLENSGGPAKARNTGLEYATGEFVLFVDADDFIENNAIELMIAEQVKHDADLVISSFNKAIDNKEIIKWEASFSNDYKLFKDEYKVLSRDSVTEYAKWYLKNPGKYLILAYCWGRLFKLSFIKNNNIIFNTDMQFFEDVVFNFEYLKYCDKTLFLNIALYNYTIQTNFVSAGMRISENLLPNVKILVGKVGEYLLINTTNNKNIKRETAYTLVHLIIVHLVRICGQINSSTKKRIYNIIYCIVHDSSFKDSIKYYTPNKGNSKLLPLFMKLKQVKLIMTFCKYKSYKRYGRGGVSYGKSEKYNKE